MTVQVGGLGRTHWTSNRDMQITLTKSAKGDGSVLDMGLVGEHDLQDGDVANDRRRDSD